MRISDWSSDVCSSALRRLARPLPAAAEAQLKQDKAGTIKAVLVVQVDTASSTANDIAAIRKAIDAAGHGRAVPARHHRLPRHHAVRDGRLGRRRRRHRLTEGADDAAGPRLRRGRAEGHGGAQDRSEEHPSELQSLMRITYAVF